MYKHTMKDFMDWADRIPSMPQSIKEESAIRLLSVAYSELDTVDVKILAHYMRSVGAMPAEIHLTEYDESKVRAFVAFHEAAEPLIEPFRSTERERVSEQAFDNMSPVEYNVFITQTTWG